MAPIIFPKKISLGFLEMLMGMVMCSWTE